MPESNSIGRTSIIYLCLNQIVILFVRRYFHSRLIVLAVVMIILYILSIIFSRTFMRGFAGFKSSTRFKIILLSVLVMVLGVSVIGVNYLQGIRNTRTVSVNLPDWNKINTQKLSGPLPEIIALNLKYLTNTQWTEGHNDSFLRNSNYRGANRNLSRNERAAIMKGINSFKNWRNERRLYVPNTISSTHQENSIRPWGHMCFVMSSALKFNLYDEDVTGITESDALNMTLKLIESLAEDHCSNTYQGWGDKWQSALWAENIAYSAWLLWDKLSDRGRYFVVNMLKYEAERFIDYDVPCYMGKDGEIIHEGDTKGEENAWNSRILALASCMLSDDKYNAKLTELLLSSSAAPDDVNSSGIVDGFALRDILNGSNINSDGTVINHKLIHIDYMMTIIEGMLDTAIIFGLSGREIPKASTFNLNRIYSALVNVNLGTYDPEKEGHHFYERTIDEKAGPEVNMPGVNDWGGKWYSSYYLIDTVAELFNADTECPGNLKASDWALQHLNELHRMIMRNSTGQFFIDGENNFVSGETYAMQNVIKAYLLRRLLN